MRPSLILMSLALAGGLGSSSLQAQDEALVKQLQQRETAAWKAVQAHDTAGFRALMAPDYHSLYAGGPEALDDELVSLTRYQVRSYRLSDFTLSRLAPGRVLVTYKTVVDADYSGQNTSGTYWNASIWRNEGGVWKGVFHAEVKAE